MELIVAWGLWNHPLVLPVAVLWCLAVTVVWVVLRHLPASWGRRQPSGWSWVTWCVFGIFAAVTLTPSRIGLGLDLDTRQQVWCHPEWPRTWFGLRTPSGERRWNVLLGVALGLVAGGWAVARRRTLVALAAPALVLGAPLAVELAQAELPALGRVCAVVDAVDNVSGVLIGLAAGASVSAALAWLRRPRRRPAA